MLGQVMPRADWRTAIALAIALSGPASGADAGGCPATGGPALQAPALPLPRNALRIGVALGSGSIHGMAHVGVIEELEARGLDAKIVTGTSVGAVVGSLWASGMSGRQIESLGRRTDWSGGDSFAYSWQGLYSSSDMRDKLAAIFKGRPIESWPRRFGAVATNLSNGSRRIFASGDGALAAQASSAVPVLFSPIKVDGETFADGALVEPVPVDAARELGADFVIGIDVEYRPYEEKASGMLDYAFQSLHILTNALSARLLRDADVAIRIDLHGTMTRCGESALIPAGREAVRAAWPEIVRKVAARAAKQ